MSSAPNDPNAQDSSAHRVETDPDVLSHIEANLTLTYEQRLRQMVRAVRFLERARLEVEKLRAALR